MQILYGGTFDPVHEGHLAIARAAAAALGHPVSLLPSADPPHRARPGASAEQRATMLELAIADDARLRVDRRELHRQGPSFTVDTLQEVRTQRPTDCIIWLMGIDSLVQLDSWHQWRRIFDMAHVLGAERPRTRVDQSWLQQNAPTVFAEVAPRWRQVEELAACASGFYAGLPVRPLRSESASQVREAIAAGMPWTDRVPAAVARYIDQQGLYRPASAS